MKKWLLQTASETSESIKVRVQAARKVQAERFGSSKTNGEMNLIEIKEYCKLDEEGQQVIKQAMKQYNFSGRSLHRILKVSRTIADLAGVADITTQHLAEAIMYRPKSGSTNLQILLIYKLRHVQLWFFRRRDHICIFTITIYNI